jgi:Resolvase, N terminal domain
VARCRSAPAEVRRNGKIDEITREAVSGVGRFFCPDVGSVHGNPRTEITKSSIQDQQSIDTTTSAGRLMFQVTGAFAEFERSMIRQRIHAGLKRAVEQGKMLGRPRISETLEKRIQAHLRAGKGILKVAREVGVGTGTVHRIAREMPHPFDAAA